MADTSNMNEVKKIEDAAKAADPSDGTTTSAAASADTVKVETEEAEVAAGVAPSKEDVTQAIKESGTLITAVESVAAMYAIPSSHIINDPSLNSIKVVRDNILVPSTNSKPTENGKAIVQAIGAVLDYISQRVDNKVNQFQNNNIAKAEAIESIKNNADPSKGKVISRHVDANGDEVLVYDSGLVDLANTKEAHAKVDELRAAGQIPNYEYDPEAINKKVDTDYFSDADDIGTDVDMNASSTPDTGSDSTSSVDVVKDSSLGDLNMGSSVPSTPTETNIGSVTEYATYIDAIAARGDTRHLGYELMQEAGFDFVKPVNMILESDDGKKKNASPYQVQHMKFDNSNLLKAIKFMNEARKEQKDTPNDKLDIEKFINSKNYLKAIDALNTQFNIRLNIRHWSKKGSSETNAYTTTWNDLKRKMTISKSKGFQLGGQPIDVFIINTAMTDDAPRDISLFGQHYIALLCHEIFHNIMAVIADSNAEFNATFTTTMTIAETLPTAKARRKLISNFVNTLDTFNGSKLNIVTRRLLVKQLVTLSAISRDDKAIDTFMKALKENPSSEDIDKMIRRLSSNVATARKSIYGSKPGYYITAGLFITVGLIAGVASGLWPLVILGFGAGAGVIGIGETNRRGKIETIESYKRGKLRDYEEHWCDMFAAMYNLPTTFFIGYGVNEISPSDMTIEQLKKWNNLEREALALRMGHYPTTLERCHSAVKYAKKTLDSGVQLDPSIKKYLEWIVETFSGTLELDIDTTYNKATFDPKTAEDLDLHIDHLINRGNIQVTESDFSWLNTLGENDTILD